MAKIIFNGNHVYFRHWFRWYVVRGREAKRMHFDKTIQTDKSLL